MRFPSAAVRAIHSGSARTSRCSCSCSVKERSTRSSPSACHSMKPSTHMSCSRARLPRASSCWSRRRAMALASPPPQTLVVFGASGDLTHRKLLPALYDLAYEGLLPEHYAIVGSGGSALDDADFRERARSGIEDFSRHRLDEARWAGFAKRLKYVSAPLDDPDAFGPLRDRLVTLDAEVGGEGRRLFYCATPPSAFPTIVRRI